MEKEFDLQQPQQHHIKPKPPTSPIFWQETTLIPTQKKAHSKQIISISPFDQNTFLTSSEDHTIRLWDLRQKSSVKIIRNKCLCDDLSSCSNDRQKYVYIGSGTSLYGFDLRRQQIFIENLAQKARQKHFDQINHVGYCKTEDQAIIAACDDQGDIRMYSNQELQIYGLLDKKHSNICYTFDFLHSKKHESPILVSGGYDCRINIWDTSTCKTLKTIDIQQLFKKHHISANSLPMIYCVHCNDNTIMATTQTGHIVALPFNEPKKPKFILQASLAGVISCRIANFNKNILLSLSKDGSFSLFDYSKRDKGYPQFIQKYKATNEPHWLETIQNHIIIATSDPQLSIYTIKG